MGYIRKIPEKVVRKKKTSCICFSHINVDAMPQSPFLLPHFNHVHHIILQTQPHPPCHSMNSSGLNYSTPFVLPCQSGCSAQLSRFGSDGTRESWQSGPQGGGWACFSRPHLQVEKLQLLCTVYLVCLLPSLFFLRPQGLQMFNAAAPLCRCCCCCCADGGGGGGGAKGATPTVGFVAMQLPTTLLD